MQNGMCSEMARQSITEQKYDHPGYPSQGKSSMSSFHRGGTFNSYTRMMVDTCQQCKSEREMADMKTEKD